MPNAYDPRPEHKFSFGLWTVCNRGRDPFGDVNRKSIAGVVSGFTGALAFCVWIVLRHGLPAPWIGLAIAIAISTTALELFSPRGTDDFTMATGNALICLVFGTVLR